MDFNRAWLWLVERDFESLQCGDIIFRASNRPDSKIIRWGTNGDASHVCVYIARGRAVSAEWSGVKMVSVRDYLSPKSRCWIYRADFLNREMRLQFAFRAMEDMNRDYSQLQIAAKGLDCAIRKLAGWNHRFFSGLLNPRGSVNCDEHVAVAAQDAFGYYFLPSPKTCNPADMLKQIRDEVELSWRLILRSDDRGVVF